MRLKHLEVLAKAVRRSLVANAEHHISMSKAHALATETEEENSAESQFHKNESEVHAQAAEEVVDCVKTVDSVLKTMDDDLGKSFLADEREEGELPEGLSRVAPERSDTLRLVPRSGSPAPQTDKSVPLIFQKMISVDDDLEA
jgi:hypothetical protein